MVVLVWRAKQTQQATPPAGANWENIGVKATGAYNNATAYEIDELVSYNNTLYRCIADSTGNVPTDTSYWELFIVGYNFTGDYNNATEYQVNDIVKHGGQLYICTAISTGNLPTDTSYWAQYTSGTAWKGTYDGNSLCFEYIVKYGYQHISI